MENESNRCCRCEYFDRYFTKGAKRYNMVPFGWCCKKIATVGSREGCEQFKRKLQVAKRPWQLRACLDNVLTEISEIRKVLEGDADESAEMEEV